jgi:hypothetical protein
MLDNLAYREVCTWGTYLKNGETCSEYKTREQGVFHPGCVVCQAKKILEELKEK